MIESIKFENFKALRDTTLPLQQFTLIVGPNGSGKSSALEALDLHSLRLPFDRVLSAGADQGDSVRVSLNWSQGAQTVRVWTKNNNRIGELSHSKAQQALVNELNVRLQRTRLFRLDALSMTRNNPLQPQAELSQSGSNLVVVLDRMRDEAPERFEALNLRLSDWLPEFDRVLFDTPGRGERRLALRTKTGQHRIEAMDLSQGTLLALAMLTLAYLPEPPTVVCLEEPDRGIHPRLLRDVRDALYRLSHPEASGEDREPVQVVATTHSPYLLDLFRDHPEEVVLATKDDLQARFQRLSDLPNYEEILAGSHLGDVWYSGVLGGVPAKK